MRTRRGLHRRGGAIVGFGSRRAASFTAEMNSRCSMRISFSTIDLYSEVSSSGGRSEPFSPMPRLFEMNCSLVILLTIWSECASTLSMISEYASTYAVSGDEKVDGCASA